jgi:hypothetical protein
MKFRGDIISIYTPPLVSQKVRQLANAKKLSLSGYITRVLEKEIESSYLQVLYQKIDSEMARKGVRLNLTKKYDQICLF